MTTTLPRIGFHRGQPLEVGQRVTYKGDAGTITEAGNAAMSMAALTEDEHTRYDMLVTVTLDDPTRKPVHVGTANVVVIRPVVRVGMAIVQVTYFVDDDETDADVERHIREELGALPRVLTVTNLGGISTDPATC